MPMLDIFKVLRSKRYDIYGLFGKRRIRNVTDPAVLGKFYDQAIRQMRASQPLEIRYEIKPEHERIDDPACTSSSEQHNRQLAYVVEEGL